MENINRDKIHELVSVFYQPTFKTFYVNSVDGETTCRPIGVFVSLGITTSMNVLNNIKDIIGNNKEYNATLVEISSKKVDDQFINHITSRDPKQYLLANIDDSILKRDEAVAELDKLKNLMSPTSDLETIKNNAPKVSRLKYLIDKLDESDGWNAHRIQKENDGGYRIYHMYVNYEKRDGLEYRIGIFVNEKQDSVD